MPENVIENSQPRKLLSESPNLKEIDALLLSGLTLLVVRKKVIEQFGERFSRRAYQVRRAKLKKLAQEAKVVKVTEGARPGSLMHQLKTISADLAMVANVKLDTNDEWYQTVEAVKKRIQSYLRRSAEYYEEVDHLAILRFGLNTQHDRVAQMREMELKLGMLLKDETTNIELLIEIVMKSLEAHQSLGLKPKFGDPSVNLQVNVGAGGQVNFGNGTQSERNTRLEEVEKALHGLTGEERDKKLREIAFKHAGIKDASFEDVKRAEGDAKT